MAITQQSPRWSLDATRRLLPKPAPTQVGRGSRRPVRGRGGEVPPHQVAPTLSCGFCVGRAYPAPAGGAADPRGAKQPLRLVPADLIAAQSRGLPRLARPLDPVVRLPQSHQRRGHRRVTASPQRRRTRLGVVASRRGDRQLCGDRLDPELTSVDVNEVHHHLCGRSSSAARKADAERRIAFARRDSRTSCSNALIFARSSLAAPGTAPWSMSAWRTQARAGSTPLPS